MTDRPSSVLTAIPNATTTPSELRLYAPAPVARAIGGTPKTKVPASASASLHPSHGLTS